MNKLLIYIAILLSCGAGNLAAQTVSATLDRNKILLGEQISLQLKVEDAAGLTQWFSIPDSINHLEVVERGKLDTISIAGTYILQQSIRITSFDSGQWQFPALQINTARGELITQPQMVEVLPVDVSDMADYHDIKEIVEVPANNNTAITIIIALMTLLAAVAVWWLARKKQGVKVPAAVVKHQLSSLAWALQELLALQNDAEAQSSPRLLYQRLTTICRQFFALEIQGGVQHKTLSEWMIDLQSLPVEQGIKVSFFQMLRLAEVVKFAKYIPTPAEQAQAIPISRQLMQQVYNLQHYSGIEPKNPAA